MIVQLCNKQAVPAKQNNHAEAAVEQKPIKKAPAKSTAKQVTIKKENSKTTSTQVSAIDNT